MPLLRSASVASFLASSLSRLPTRWEYGVSKGNWDISSLTIDRLAAASNGNQSIKNPGKVRSERDNGDRGGGGDDCSSRFGVDRSPGAYIGWSVVFVDMAELKL